MGRNQSDQSQQQKHTKRLVLLFLVDLMHRSYCRSVMKYKYNISDPGIHRGSYTIDAEEEYLLWHLENTWGSSTYSQFSLEYLWNTSGIVVAFGDLLRVLNLFSAYSGILMEWLTGCGIWVTVEVDMRPQGAVAVVHDLSTQWPTQIKESTRAK